MKELLDLAKHGADFSADPLGKGNDRFGFRTSESLPVTEVAREHGKMSQCLLLFETDGRPMDWGDQIHDFANIVDFWKIYGQGDE